MRETDAVEFRYFLLCLAETLVGTRRPSAGGFQFALCKGYPILSGCAQISEVGVHLTFNIAYARFLILQRVDRF